MNDPARQVHLISTELAGNLRTDGFSAVDDDTFSRSRSELLDVISLCFPHVSRDRFTLFVDIDAPSLAPEMRCKRTNRLGWLSLPLKGPKPYLSRTEEQIAHSVQAACKFLREDAFPWFASFATPTDVAVAFWRRWIRMELPPKDGECGEGYVWATYGLMLRSLGRTKEALPWLERAAEELLKPVYVSSGQAGHFAKPFEGCRTIEASPSAIATADITRQAVADILRG